MHPPIRFWVVCMELVEELWRLKFIIKRKERADCNAMFHMKSKHVFFLCYFFLKLFSALASY